MATSVDLADLEDQYGLPPGLLSAVMHVESGGNPEAIGPQTKSGERAQGAFQFMPATAKQYGVDDPFDLAQSATGAAKYFADLSKRTGGDVPAMLAAYNWGPGNVANKGVDAAPAETQKYIKDVQSKMSVDPADVLPVDSGAIDPADVMYHQAPSAPTAEQTSPLQAALIAGGSGFDRLAAGARQAVPSAVRAWVDSLGKTLGMGQPPSIDPAVQAANAVAAKGSSDQHPIAAFAGQLPQAFLAKTPLGMAAMGGLEYGTPEERAANAAGGYVGGKLGGYLAQGLGRLVNPVRAADPGAANEVAALAKQYGINLTAPEYTGSKPLNAFYSTMATFPGSAGTMAKVAEANSSAFNKAALGTIGESGMLSPEGNIPFDATAQIARNFGPKYDAAVKGVTIPTQNNDALINGLAAVETKYGRNLTPDQRPIVSQYMDDILSQPSISGDAYQAWRARIGARAASTNDSELKGALKGIQGVLDNAFTQAAPDAQSAAMNATRAQYQNFKTLEPLINKASLSTDNLSPAQLAARAMASGNMSGPLGDLAKVGAVLKEYPNSGTAPRMMFQKILENPSTIAGGLGAGVGEYEGGPTKGAQYGVAGALGARAFPWLLARMLTSGAGNAYLSRGLLNISPEADAALRRIGQVGGGTLGLLSGQ